MENLQPIINKFEDEKNLSGLENMCKTINILMQHNKNEVAFLLKTGRGDSTHEIKEEIIHLEETAKAIQSAINWIKPIENPKQEL